jgi:hypothetical protein
MRARRILVLAALVVLALPLGSARADIGVGVNFGRPVYRPPCYRRPYYRPYCGPAIGVYVGPGPVVAPPPPVVVQPAPLVVQQPVVQQPVAVQPAPVPQAPPPAVVPGP